MKNLGLKAALTAALLTGGAVNAQTAGARPLPKLDLSRFDLNPGAEDSLVSATGKLSKTGKLRVSLLGAYLSQPSVTRLNDGAPGAQENARLGDRFEGHATFSYAFHPRFQLHAQLPVVLMQNQGEALTARSFAPVASSGVGSPLVGLRIGLLEQSEASPVNLALGIAGGLPVGSGDALVRDPQPRFVPSLSMGRDFENFSVGAQVYARFRSQENFQFRGVSSDPADTVTHELGAAFSLSSEIARGVRAELGVISDFAVKDGGATVQTFLGARHWLDQNVELFAGGGPAFGSLAGTPDFRVLAGLAFGGQRAAVVEEKKAVVAVNPDRDGDGIPNDMDECPDVGEDIDGFEDSDGCPDEDNDRDGIADIKDVCPDIPGQASRGGCPILDEDMDGIADEVDLCPSEPGTRAEAGCPVKDADKDGIADRDDHCVNEVGLAQYRGCPAPDADKDGIADADDNCVNEAGPKSNQGCPEKQKQLVIIQKEQLQILDKVYFMPAKAQIVTRSRVLLDQIAKILKEHAEIPKVRVEGHTDSVGKDETNRKLSEARAAAVMKYLIQKGVQKERLEAVGFGPDRPVDNNATDAGREANRRVDFVIVAP